MKNKLAIVILLIFQLSSNLHVKANEVAEPYVVAQAINYDVIDSELCISLIRNFSNSTDTSSEVSMELVERIDQIQRDIEQLNTDYQVINDQIATLESGDDQSLTEAQRQLELVVEAIYHDYLTHDEYFPQLTQDEQLAIIAEHPTVIEWQNYRLNIQQLINELVVERDTIENTYYQLTYDFDNLTSQLEAEKSNQAQLNQCLLYPYSVPYFPSDQMMLNQQISSLEEYLVELDYYLQKLVPTPYRKVTFYDIYRLFSYDIDDVTTTDFGKKQPIRFDEAGLMQYTYAKELSLYDIEIVSDYAKATYADEQDLTFLTSEYQKTLDLKELQFDYFYYINPEAFEWLKEQLAVYLNQKAAYDDQAVELVQTMHNRYQIKLVYLDEVNQQWVANIGASNGYYGQFYDAPLLEALAVNRISGNLMTAQEQNIAEHALANHEMYDNVAGGSNPSYLDTTKKLADSKSDHLDELKDKLSQPNSSNSQSKLDDLPKPQELSSSKLKEKPANKSSQLKLPDTGEQRFYMYLGMGLLIIGLCLLFANQRVRRRKRENIENIELD